MRIIPSAEQVAKTSPCDFGPNLQSVTLVRESTRFVRRTQCLTGVIVGVVFPPMVSSQTETVRSNEHVARTVPNSGWAHERRHTEPEWAFQLAATVQTPFSFWSQICWTENFDNYSFVRSIRGLGIENSQLSNAKRSTTNLNILIAGTSRYAMAIIIV